MIDQRQSLNFLGKIILISFKKDIKSFDVENLGAILYDLCKDIGQSEYVLNTDSISPRLKNFVGYFFF